MSLRRTALLLIGSTIAVSVLILFVYSRLFLLGSFQKLEDDQTARNVVRVSEAIVNKMNEMTRITGDYATWDDTYKFIQDKNAAYIKSNITNNTLDNLKINLMVFVNSQGQIVQANYYDLEKQEQLSFPVSLKKDWSGLYPLLTHKTVESRVSGLTVLPEGILLLASRPIITSKSVGPIRGSLIFGRFLDQVEIAQLKKQTNLEFSIKLVEDPALPEDFKKAAALVMKIEKPLITPINADLNGGYQELNDIYGRPAALIRVEIPREVTRQGRGLVWNYSLFLLTVGAVLAMVILFLLERMILNRVFRIGSEVNAIAKSGDSAKRVKFSSQDELGVLAGQINDMLEALEAARLNLNESENKFKQLFDATPEAIFLEDIEGRIIDCNQAALKMTGYTREEILKLHSYKAEAEGKRKNGEVFPQEVIVRAIEIENQKYFLVVIRDISERKILDHKLNERVAELEEFHDTVIGRELKMMELEKEIDALLAELGREPKYHGR